MTQPYPPPYGQMPPAPAPTRRHRKWPWIVGAVVLLLVIVGVANGGKSAAPAGAPQAAAPTVAPAGAPQAADPTEAQGSGSTVVYEVTGSGRASVTYMKQGFSQEQQQNAKLPFRKEVAFTEEVGPFVPVSLVAQHNGGSGDITCRITVDGKVVQTATSNGSYAVVTCNGTG